MEWPRTTKYHCWYCVHAFDTCPVALPTRYDDRRKIFYVVGVFCTWGCAKKYNLERDSVNKTNSATLLTLLRHRLLGSQKYKDATSYSITIAPERNRLLCFGGDLTIEQFRSGLQSLVLEDIKSIVGLGNGEIPTTDRYGNFSSDIWAQTAHSIPSIKRCDNKPPPMYDNDGGDIAAQEVEPAQTQKPKRKNSDNQGSPSIVLDSIVNAPSVKNQPYKLKRSKPIGNVTNTLFQSMKLKIEKPQP